MAENNQNNAEEIIDETLENQETVCEEISEEANDTKAKKSKFKKKSNEELENALKQVDELNDKILRNMAEFDNFRRRTQKEKETTFQDAKVKTLTPIIGILDNLERAAETQTEDTNYKQGVELVLKQFKEVLSTLDVNEIEAIGQKLDPNFHMAVMHVEDAEKGESEIVQVLQKGYAIGDRVIRCSMVAVAN